MCVLYSTDKIGEISLMITDKCVNPSIQQSHVKNSWCLAWIIWYLAKKNKWKKQTSLWIFGFHSVQNTLTQYIFNKAKISIARICVLGFNFQLIKQFNIIKVQINVVMTHTVFVWSIQTTAGVGALCFYQVQSQCNHLQADFRALHASISDKLFGHADFPF